ncbi:unnamed protein product [Prunus armeniaca]|uniref:PGG domain-containing protein n=1 Tax=Prunus armeniaca TaxID=36596 RepID=A0A6J5TDM8_PRUAR|nr:unnamed protein product [Prunus armeniaca]
MEGVEEGLDIYREEEELDIYREEEELDIYREDEVEEVNITPEDAALYKLAHELFDNAMNGQWEEVVGVYRSSENVHDMRITKIGDTALHIAASDGETEIVLHLLRIIGNDASRILQIKNKKGNTPLHLAAEVGDVETCHAMATKDRKLVSSRNDKNETPLFLAALKSKECGLSPLHILANTPSAFKSSSRLRLFDRLIYQCLIAEELKGQEAKSWGNRICSSLSLAKRGNKKEDAENPQQKNSSMQGTNQREEQGRQRHPNYIYASFVTICYLITEALVEMYRFLRGLLGISSIQKIHQDKRKHKWATQVMNQLLDHTSSYMYAQNPKETRPTDESKITQVPKPPELEKPELDTKRKKDKNVGDKQMKRQLMTPILIAAKMGVSEMVEKILKKFPVAIHDVDSENKNVALLAIENRQSHVLKLLLMEKKKSIANLLRQVDIKGNNALHLAAKYGSYRPWHTPGAALQMQWELKWYMVVKNSMRHHFVRNNDEGKTPQEIFTTSHKHLRKEGSDWLVKTSESCSVVAALIATVAFATSASVPGGLDDKTGSPVFEDKPAFNAFTISSLLALCLSVTALVFFLSIITSRYEVDDFSISLPRKLLLGLTSLFASIASVLVSFCTGHTFLLNQQLRHVAYPLYATTCIPITIFALAQLPLYYDLIKGIFTKVPQQTYME